MNAPSYEAPQVSWPPCASNQCTGFASLAQSWYPSAVWPLPSLPSAFTPPFAGSMNSPITTTPSPEASASYTLNVPPSPTTAISSTSTFSVTTATPTQGPNISSEDSTSMYPSLDAKSSSASSASSALSAFNASSASMTASPGITSKHSHAAAIAGSIIGILVLLLIALGVWFARRRRRREMAPSSWFIATGILPKPGLAPIQVRGVPIEPEGPPPAYEQIIEQR
ncbi:hypothetical protein DAEQUDRAFT_765809 [Daedalea quercina L-15889]|uniref:Uncharacterized protein n=1 Tax=Daedalea quercina L-15889 TaxID=1314783 RepID=A0A165Q5J0_9APHY|nr:hypothetical protein DAEQUDRAFT_765809 [Daedalea quercina L-15889]